MSEIKGCMNCGNISCPNNKKRDCAGCGRYISPEDKIKEYEAQIKKMKCCGNCMHCKYDENEDSYEWCEVHEQIVNIAIVPCSEWKGR